MKNFFKSTPTLLSPPSNSETKVSVLKDTMGRIIAFGFLVLGLSSGCAAAQAERDWQDNYGKKLAAYQADVDRANSGCVIHTSSGDPQGASFIQQNAASTDCRRAIKALPPQGGSSAIGD